MRTSTRYARSAPGCSHCGALHARSLLSCAAHLRLAGCCLRRHHARRHRSASCSPTCSALTVATFSIATLDRSTAPCATASCATAPRSHGRPALALIGLAREAAGRQARGGLAAVRLPLQAALDTWLLVRHETACIAGTADVSRHEPCPCPCGVWPHVRRPAAWPASSDFSFHSISCVSSHGI